MTLCRCFSRNQSAVEAGGGRWGLTNRGADAAKEGFPDLFLQHQRGGLGVKAQQRLHCCALPTLCMHTYDEQGCASFSTFYKT